MLLRVTLYKILILYLHFEIIIDSAQKWMLIMSWTKGLPLKWTSFKLEIHFTNAHLFYTYFESPLHLFRAWNMAHKCRGVPRLTRGALLVHQRKPGISKMGSHWGAVKWNEERTSHRPGQPSLSWRWDHINSVLPHMTNGGPWLFPFPAKKSLHSAGE